MKILGTVITKEFVYDSDEERNKHVSKMVAEGWKDSGQDHKDMNMSFRNPDWKPYSRLFKYE